MKYFQSDAKFEMRSEELSSTIAVHKKQIEGEDQRIAIDARRASLTEEKHVMEKERHVMEKERHEKQMKVEQICSIYSC